MRFCVRFSALFFLIALQSYAQSQSSQTMGTVAICEGDTYLREGIIDYKHPQIGELISVNSFGQYRGSAPRIAKYAYNEDSSKILRNLDSIPEKGILETGDDGFCKILFQIPQSQSEMVIDIGPKSAMLFNESGFKILKGTLKIVSALKPPQSLKFLITTPNTEIRLKGTALLVSVELPDAVPQSADLISKNEGKRFSEKFLSALYHNVITEITVLHGLVVADTYQLSLEGFVYAQQNILKPSSFFAAEGPHGITTHKEIKNISQKELRRYVKKFSPLVNTYATVAGLKPIPALLPGTGVDFQGPKDAVIVRENFLMPVDFETNQSQWSSFSKLIPLTTSSNLPLIPSYYKR